MSTDTIPPGRPGTPIVATDEQLGAVKYDAAGLVCAIVQEVSTKEVLMVAYMDQEALRRTLESGRTWFYSRSRQEYWLKGETSGDRQYVRSLYYDCDGDALLVEVDQEGKGACHTGERTCFYRAFEILGAVQDAGFERFASLAAEHRVVPLVEELLADSLTPVGAFRSIVGPNDGFLFESVEHGERFSRYSFIGRNPQATLVANGRAITVLRGELPSGVPLDSGVLACLEALLDRYSSPTLPELPPMHGGLVGYLGYDVVREVERLGPPPPDDRQLPDAVMSVIGELVAFDHWRSRVLLVDNTVLDERADSEVSLRAEYDKACGRLEALRTDLERPVQERLARFPQRGGHLDPASVRRVVSSAAYVEAVEAAKEYIAAGDAFQIVLSQRFDLEFGVEPFEVYRALRQVNPSPYMFFLRQGGVSVVGASPEPLVQLRERRVISRPIAGTRPRGATVEEDRLLGAELVEHPKERAEHVMLVDLARNDVGRVVRFGTEQVDELMTLEHYSHVMHLTSQVSGEIADGKSPIDVLRATLPAGTVSGAPKVRAMEIIDELEPTKRGPYAGTVGYLDFSGNLDTAIAIRTLVVGPDGRASVQAGAGIVADSDPVAEDLECQAKAQAILSAVAAARHLAKDASTSQEVLR